MSVKHDGINYELLNITYVGTKYGERCVVSSRSAKVMMSKFEEVCICEHGSPNHFSADPEFPQPLFKNYLHGQNIQINDRSARSTYKNGRVERNNAVSKSIIEKISKEKMNVDIELLLARTSFPTNSII